MGPVRAFPFSVRPQSLTCMDWGTHPDVPEQMQGGNLARTRKILVCCGALILLALAVRTATAGGIGGFAARPTSAGHELNAENLGMSVFRGSAKLLQSVASRVSSESAWLTSLAASSESFESTTLVLFGAGFLGMAFVVRRRRTAIPKI